MVVSAAATAFSSAWSESGYGQDPFAMAVYNGKLYFFGQDGQLKLKSASLKDVLRNSDATIVRQSETFKGALTSTDFAVNSGNDTLHSESPSACAATVVGGHLCLIWNDDGNGPVAAVCDTSTIDGSTRPWYALQTPTGGQLGDIVPSSNDLTATALDTDNVLIAAQCTVDDQRSVWIGQYQLTAKRIDATTDDPGTWQAVAAWTIPLHQLANAFLNTDDLDTSLQMTWYSFGQPKKPGDAATSFLGFTLYHPDQAGYLCWLPMDYATAPTLSIAGSYGRKIDATGQVFRLSGYKRPLAVERAPGGSIHLYGVWKAFGKTTIQILQMPSNSPPSQPTVRTKLEACVLPNGADQLDVDLPLVPVFLVSDQAVETIVTNDPTNSGSVPALPVGEAIFAHTDNAVNYYSQGFGRLQRVLNVPMATTANTNIVAVQGIFDGPFPMPHANLARYFTTVSSFADVRYGTSREETSSRSKSTTVTFGVKSSAETTKGVGPAWDISFEGGFGWGWSESAGSISVVDRKQSLTLDAETEHNVVPNGSICGTAVEFTANVYRFLVPDPTAQAAYKVSPDACVWASMWAAPIGEVSVPYTPYSVTPGDITSYTRDAWNWTMYHLGYPSLNYFDEVIVVNALTFPGLDSKKYLEVAVEVGSSPKVEVDLTESHFTESKWVFDSSVYYGISGGMKVGIMGIDLEEFHAKLLFGTSSSIESDSTTGVTTSWGITVDNIYLPKFVPGDGTKEKVGVETFTARVYLLPASPRWTEELRALRPEMAATIDPRSEPWRIVYEVTSYTLTDGTQYPEPREPVTAAQAPTVDVSKMEYPLAPGVWQRANSVKYAVAFANSRGFEIGPWSDAQQLPATKGSCPQVTIPHDATPNSPTARRLVFRQIDQGQIQLVKTIPNNDGNMGPFYDDDPTVNFQPPPQLTIDPQEKWAGRVTGQSKVWTSNGNQVQYAVAFTFAPPGVKDPEKLPTAWARESMMSAPPASVPISLNAYPSLSNVPTFPTTPGLPICTGRNIYRTVRNATTGQTVEENVLVGHIPDNTTTTFTDLAD